MACRRHEPPRECKATRRARNDSVGPVPRQSVVQSRRLETPTTQRLCHIDHSRSVTSELSAPVRSRERVGHARPDRWALLQPTASTRRRSRRAMRALPFRMYSQRLANEVGRSKRVIERKQQHAARVAVGWSFERGRGWTAFELFSFIRRDRSQQRASGIFIDRDFAKAKRRPGFETRGSGDCATRDR